MRQTEWLCQTRLNRQNLSKHKNLVHVELARIGTTSRHRRLRLGITMFMWSLHHVCIWQRDRQSDINRHAVHIACSYAYHSQYSGPSFKDKYSYDRGKLYMWVLVLHFFCTICWRAIQYSESYSEYVLYTMCIWHIWHSCMHTAPFLVLVPVVLSWSVLLATGNYRGRLYIQVNCNFLERSSERVVNNATCFTEGS